MLSDASLDEEKDPVEQARRMTPQERIHKALELTAIAITKERKAIAEANPHLDEQEVNLLWMEQAYGKDLADQVRADLARRRQEQERS
jgi:hypothetical protein